MAVLLNKRDMAASIGISVQAFDKWGVVQKAAQVGSRFFHNSMMLKINVLFEPTEPTEPTFLRVYMSEENPGAKKIFLVDATSARIYQSDQSDEGWNKQ